MKIFTYLLAVFLLSACANNNLIHFANNFEEIAKTDNTNPTLSARLLKVREFGECYKKTCPKEVLYIAVSEFGEEPEQTLYITPKANKWKFIEWRHIPKLGEKKPTLSFTLKSTDQNVEKAFTVNVNLANIEYISE